MRTALGRLVSGTDAYDSAYSAAMERIECQVAEQAELAKQVLQWITFARRQLTASELQEALGVELGEPELDRDNCPDVDALVSCCAGLVTHDEGSGVIRLTHYTTQEYFNRTQQDWFPDAEAMITRVCTTYLSFDICRPRPYQKQYFSFSYYHPEFLLYKYAAHHWGEHAGRAPSALPEVLEFLGRTENVRAAAASLKMFHESMADKTPPSAPTTGLHLSAYFGLEAATRALLRAFRNPDPRNNSGLTPLVVAVTRRHEPVVKCLLECDAAIDAAAVDRLYRDGRTPLYLAVDMGQESIARLLLEHGAHPHGKPNRRWPLHIAARNGLGTTVQLLLQHNACVSAVDDRGETALHYAAEGGHDAIVKLLLENGATLSIDSSHRTTPLHHAVTSGNYTTVELLIAANSDLQAIDLPDTHNKTLILLAASRTRNRAEIIRLLIEHNAKLDEKDSQDRTPLYIAAEVGDEAAGQILLDNGADPNHSGRHGNILGAAMKSGNMAFVQILLQAGADANSRHHRDRGDSLLHFACRNGDERLVELLLDAGADLTIRIHSKIPHYTAPAHTGQNQSSNDS